jgi:homoserine dehydrogenase
VTLDLLLVGFGHVARRFARLAAESAPALDALGVTLRTVGIATARHGGVYDAAGLDLVRAAEDVESGRRLPAAGADPFDLMARLAGSPGRTPVLVETTPLDVETGGAALAHVRAAIARRIHVVTANKGPAAFAYGELAGAAEAAGVSWLLEGAVMDGIPVFSLVRETLPACAIDGFRGVVNSTTNYILSALEAGEDAGGALARMQAAGVAEADASLDLEGWDAAAKAAVMANVWLDAHVTPREVAREGLGADAGTRARAAQARGRRLKLVASGRRRAGAPEVRVRLEELAAGDPLAIVNGQENALEIDTSAVGRIVITQRDGGLDKTAYALLADLVTVARRHRERP